MSCPAPASIIMHSLCMHAKKKKAASGHASKAKRMEGGGGGVVGRFLGTVVISHIRQIILRKSRCHVIS